MAEFLADLRAELARAQDNTADESLRLSVDQIEVSLEVTSTLEGSGEVNTRAKAKFWVFASAEAGIKGVASSGQTSTQHLRLTLTPRVEETVTDSTGETSTVSRGLDVHGQVGVGEESPVMPVLPGGN